MSDQPDFPREEGPTPETDAVVEKLYGPLSATFPSSLAARFADHARSLERRLQEAQREHAEWTLMHGWELESALRKAGDAQRELKRVEATTYDSMLTLKAERDAALREVEELKRELDDAAKSMGSAIRILNNTSMSHEDRVYEARPYLHSRAAVAYAALAEKGKPT